MQKTANYGKFMLIKPHYVKLGEDMLIYAKICAN